MLLVKTIIEELGKISWQAEDHFCKAYLEHETNEHVNLEYVNPEDSLGKFFEQQLGVDAWFEILSFANFIIKETIPGQRINLITCKWQYIAKEYAARLFPAESNIRKLFVVFDGFESIAKKEFLNRYQQPLNKVLNKINQSEIDAEDEYININFEGDSVEQLMGIITNTSGIVIVNCRPPQRDESDLSTLDFHPLVYLHTLNALLNRLMKRRPASIRAKAIIFYGEKNRLPHRLPFIATATFATTDGLVHNVREMSDETLRDKILGCDDKSTHDRKFFMQWTSGNVDDNS